MPTADTEPQPEPPLVSVVTPVYNTVAYLRECIESVLAQTWPRLEYVVVDNCSTDGSREMAEDYARQVNWMRVVKSPQHLSQLDNYNQAVRQISPASKFTKIVAADDWMSAVAAAPDATASRRWRDSPVSRLFSRTPSTRCSASPLNRMP